MCFTFFMADYVILHATEPIAKSSVRRTSIPAQPEQTVFEERHLRFISSLGKVSQQHYKKTIIFTLTTPFGSISALT